MQVVIFTEVCYGGFGRYAGTYRVATELRDAGYSVQIVEFFTQWNQDQICKIIDKFITAETRLVGFSSTFLLPKKMEWAGRANRRSIKSEVLFGRDDIWEVLDYINHVAPQSKIMVGGAKSYLAEDPPYNEVVDFVLGGQSDESIIALADHVFYESDIKVSYKKGKCNVVLEKEYPVENYTTSRIRYDDRDLVFPGEILPIELARGCIFKCTFCSYSLIGKKVWEFNRAPDLVAEDLLDAYNKFGTTGFMFCDDTYNDSVDKVERLHKEFIKLPFDLSFSTYARADMLVTHKHTAPLLYESGMRSVFFGIETFNHKAGKSIGKGMDPQKLKDGLYELKSLPGWKDIVTTSGFIVGLPFETEDSIRATFDWLLQEDCPLDSFSPTALHIGPNSAIGKNMERYGYKYDENGEWYSEWMTERQAKGLVAEYMGQAMGRPRAYFQFTFFGRMQNIGWTLDDFDKGRYTVEESNVRKVVLQDKYFERLMHL